MWKTALKWIICVMLLAYVALAFAFGRQENGMRKCTGIDLRIEGNTLPDSVLRQGVASQLARYGKPLKGERLERIDLQRLENYLGQFSNFEWVECSFDPDSRLRITVSPISPEVRVFASDGKSYYINRSGKRIVADAEFYVDVPVLIASRGTEEYFGSALSVIRFVTSDSDLNSLITAFKIDGPNDIILIPRIQGHVINFGDSTQRAEKKAAIMTAYRSILDARGWNTYDTVSVKFRGQIVATRRDKSVNNHGSMPEEGEDLEEATLPDVAEMTTEHSTEENG